MFKIFFDGRWYIYNAATGQVATDGFFLFETSPNLYTHEVMTDLKNRTEEKVNA